MLDFFGNFGKTYYIHSDRNILLIVRNLKLAIQISHKKVIFTPCQMQTSKYKSVKAYGSFIIKPLIFFNLRTLKSAPHKKASSIVYGLHIL